MTFPTLAGHRIVLNRLSTWAILASVCGLLAEVSALPSGVRAVLLLAFILAGPGSAIVQYWSKQLPAYAVRALVPVVGLCVVILAVSGALLMGVWSTRLTLL